MNAPSLSGLNGWQIANGAAAIAVGAYIAATVFRVDGKGRTEKLWQLIKGEVGFIKWGVAAAILYWIASRPEIGEIGAGLIAFVVLAIALKIASDPTLMSGVVKAWNALPNAAPAKG